MLLLPLGPKLGAWNRDARGREKAERAESLRERSGFATTGETGKVDDRDRAMFEERGSVVESEETFNERGSIRVWKLTEDSIMAPFKVAAEVGNVSLGWGEGVRMLEGKALTGRSDEAVETLDLLSGPGGS
jgi:hypothetical protein